MIYNNLLYFLIVILLLSTPSPASAPPLGPLVAALIFLGKGFIFQIFIHRFYRPLQVVRAVEYAAAERKGAILALLFFAVDVYLLDCQYYFAKLPLVNRLPVLNSLLGILLFLGYFSMVWGAGRESYGRIFGRRYRAGAFIWTNICLNLPIILPWLLLSLVADLLAASSLPAVKAVLASAWGEYAIFLCFFLLLAVLFPALLIRLWGCTPLPAGAARQGIETFCRKQRVAYAEILSWPLFEGQVVTAGVMGFVKWFRYLLVTPALLQSLTPEEVEAVMAHELGHVKKGHLFLYLFLFLGFLPLSQLVSYPVLYLLSSSTFFYDAVRLANKEPGAALAFASALPLLVVLILYFRYIFGFFMRNFERQADLYAMEATSSCRALVRVFEKIAWLSGNTRDLPSWHHFGLGERIDYLQRCAREPRLIAGHNRKVYALLGLYLLGLLSATYLVWRLPAEPLADASREKFAEAVIVRKIQEDPQNTVWFQLLGDLHYARKEYRPAISAYEKALALAADNAEAANNLAWLLLTAAEKEVRDPARALALAQKAATVKPVPHVLDTLALGFYQNGQAAEAVLTEQRALAQDPPQREYYEAQIRKFSQLSSGKSEE